MFTKILKYLVVFLLLSTSLFAEYKFMGSFNAGESISGVGSPTNNGIEYDFVVPQYGLVEFKPQESSDKIIQYSIRDYKHTSTGGYFYVGSAAGITSQSNLSYPNGYRLLMMPGTYKVVVFAYDTPNKYSMTTSFSPSSYQTPLTGKSLDVEGNTPVAITLNTLYHDNLSFSSDVMSGNYSRNDRDWFSFTLNAKTDLKFYAKFDVLSLI